MYNNLIKAFRNNPKLQTPKAPEDWQGTPLDEKGLFINLNHPFTDSLGDVLRWQFQKNRYKKEKKALQWNPPVYKNTAWLDSKEDVLVWLGHCTFYLRIGGIKMITDPVFGDIFPLKRRSELPIDAARLTDLDFILLSHDHRDHLDEKSLRQLSQQCPKANILTGMGMEKIVHEFTASEKIQEAGWYQKYNTEKTLGITFIPSRHWSKRGLTDTNTRLWGGFVIEANNKRILFGGDSGYDTHYKQLASVFGSFDFALLGIGAYEPKWFMHANHQSPAEALKGFTELNAARFIPIHYGTFDLSDEPLSKPLEDLDKAAKEQNLENKITISEIGKALML